MPISPSKKHRFKRSPTVAYLSITSLMDMFTIILLFLLHGFSQDEGAFAISQKLTLPVSTSIEAVRPKLTIQITEEELIIEGTKVTDIDAIANDEDMLISPLYENLAEYAKRTVFIASVNPETELNREVIIQGDKGIPFRLLERVMFTCGLVGYNNISLAVLSREG